MMDWHVYARTIVYRYRVRDEDGDPISKYNGVYRLVNEIAHDYPYYEHFGTDGAVTVARIGASEQSLCMIGPSPFPR